MNTKFYLRTTLIILLLVGMAGSQPIPGYYTRSNFLFGPPSVFKEGLIGFTNPANLRFIHSHETRFIWNSEDTDAASFNDWGIFSGIKGLGFGVFTQHFGKYEATDYRLATGFGSDGFALGFGYGWSSGDLDTLGRENIITTGTIIRPFPYLSVGLSGHFSTESNQREGVAEIGIRPFGSDRLTLFADAALQKEISLSDAPWSVGGAVKVTSGIQAIGRYFENEAFTIGLTIDMGRGGVGSQLHFNTDQNHAYNTYLVRLGGMQPSIFNTLFQKNKYYLPVNLKGKVDYQKYALFDKETHRFLDILNHIRAATHDPRVRAISLNLSSIRIRPEHAWEIREELKNARKSGKMVFAFIDNAEMTEYHLASVADKIIMDPEGILTLPGYLLGRTYLKGTLEKLGLGFDEWRFFKYKSAYEGLSREKMSDADREQRQAFVDDWYELVRADVCESRNLTHQEYDKLIDKEAYFLPDRALEAGLVDTLARWSAKDEVLKKLSGASLRSISSRNLLDNALPSPVWGELPKIAVVYGLGVCAMDEGIKARWLERQFLRLAKARSVKAVIFRVDSPGGDAMASDLVAEAIKTCKKEKPVIISQGQVAGSGGYWISMYGDEIIAGANTLTGSIGVIGGWIYDKGIGNKMGMTSDFVQRGEHADLGFGITFPFLGIRVPYRNLTEEERSRVEFLIKQFYDEFVTKVAEGRGLSVERVREIGEGRIYSGIDGQEVGLVDKIGGLMSAIAVAREKAGLKPEEKFELIEIPRYKGLFPFGSPFSPFRVSGEENPLLDYIRLIVSEPGKPLPIMPPGTYPTIE
ncbi:MAG: hypothetical protein Kow0042_20090 [Calditrichia bacterium]